VVRPVMTGLTTRTALCHAPGIRGFSTSSTCGSAHGFTRTL
jgi:hypothetical protein